MQVEDFLVPLEKGLSTIRTVARINKTAGLVRSVTYITAATVLCINLLQLLKK